MENFRDWLALVAGLAVFPSIWVLQGLGILNLAGEIGGAIISL